MREPVIETSGGRYVNLLSPKAEEIHLDDIVGPLSKACRFAGHVKRFYSVAEHALLVSEVVELIAPHHSPVLAFAALHHDSHEAYLGDATTPLKALVGDELALIAGRLDVAIARRWGIDVEQFTNHVVKWADTFAVRVEARELKHSRGVGEHWGYQEEVFGMEGRHLGMPDYLAAAAFRARHNELLEEVAA